LKLLNIAVNFSCISRQSPPLTLAATAFITSKAKG
jgi:hypothetical protein